MILNKFLHYELSKEFLILSNENQDPLSRFTLSGGEFLINLIKIIATVDYAEFLNITKYNKKDDSFHLVYMTNLVWVG